MEINKLAQYNRLSFMLEPSCIPRQDDENVIDLVNNTALAAGICNVNVIQVDIAHRVSDKGTAPVTVLFNRKADRTSFYRQKNRLCKVQANHIAKSNTDNNGDSEVSLPGLERENSFIYMNESLTSINRMLLRDASKTSKKRLKYKFPRYIVNGQVQVKISKSSEYYINLACY